MRSLADLLERSGALRDCPAWGRLESHAETVSTLSLRDLLDEPDRFEQFSRRIDLSQPGPAGNEWMLDFSRQLMTGETLDLLLELAEQRQLEDWIQCLFSGEAVNTTEDRPALHTALRRADDRPLIVDGRDVMPMVRSEQERVLKFADAVRGGTYKSITGIPFTDVVNIGIGGSDLGLVMVAEALHQFSDPQLRTHFISNIDGSQLADVLDQVSPETTLFIVCSKSFTTLETQLNANTARDWLLAALPEDSIGRHFAAVSVNDPAMDQFGISDELRFRIWDWVGGRYSLWSAVGLSLAITLGEENFKALLAGAGEVDLHFRQAAPGRNLPVLMALIGIWNQNFLGATSHAVLPYDGRLRYFPAFLQQLEMESNGKRVTHDGQVIDYPTGTVIWGEPGSNAQHSFFQLLHQGSARVSMDFIAPVEASSHLEAQHAQGLANMLAQAEAFARGRTAEEIQADSGQPATAEKLIPHKVHPGNRCSGILLFQRLDPASLGALIALYEHKVFAQAVIWGINPFDQWGVELGKMLARELTGALSGTAPAEGLPGIGLVIRRWSDR